MRLGVVFVAVLRKAIKIKRDKFFALHAQINEKVRKTQRTFLKFEGINRQSLVKSPDIKTL